MKKNKTAPNKVLVLFMCALALISVASGASAGYDKLSDTCK